MAAAGVAHGAQRSWNVEAGAEASAGMAEDGFVIDFLDDAGSGGRSELRWEEMDRTTVGLQLAAEPLPWLRLEGAWETGDLDGGVATDEDYLVPEDFLFSRSVAEVSGDTEAYRLLALVRVDGWLPGGPWPVAVRVAGGYARQMDELLDKVAELDAKLKAEREAGN